MIVIVSRTLLRAIVMTIKHNVICVRSSNRNGAVIEKEGEELAIKSNTEIFILVVQI